MPLWLGTKNKEKLLVLRHTWRVAIQAVFVFRKSYKKVEVQELDTP